MILEAVMIGVFSALFGNKKKGLSALTIIGLIIALLLGVWTGSKVKPPEKTFSEIPEKPKKVLPQKYTNYTDEDIIKVQDLTGPTEIIGVVVLAGGGPYAWDEPFTLRLCDKGYCEDWPCNCSPVWTGYAKAGKSGFDFIFEEPITIEPPEKNKQYVLFCITYGGYWTEETGYVGGVAWTTATPVIAVIKK